MVPISLTKVLILMLTAESIAGIACRFARTSASQGSCTFPCHCTKGCNQDTGDCINGGQCKDGPPSGHFWNGTACQIGNIAYKKAIIEHRHFRSEMVVDGSITSCSLVLLHRPIEEDVVLTIDLGKEYRIFRVGVFAESPFPFSTFILRVGNSSNATTHSGCGIWHGHLERRLEAGITCESVTRYISLRIHHIEDIFELCELVVIGYQHIRCDRCPSTSMCNDVIGCDECPPGKQLPDCTKDCASGTYGINCVEDCGHCKNSAPCAVTDGQCPGGCDQWYLSDTCKTYIPVPHFEASDKLDVVDITRESAVLGWPTAHHIPTGLESRYYYIVLLDVDGKMEKNVAKLPHKIASGQFQFHITGLEFNMQYSVRVKPYRQHNSEHQGGTSTGIVGFKTNCREPSVPVIESVQTSACGSIVVKWKPLGDSGCDEIMEVRVWYKRQSSKKDDWLYKELDSVNETSLTVDYLTIEQHEVKVRVTNNKDLVSDSKIVIADFQKFQQSQAITAAGVGLAVGTFLLGVLIGGGGIYVACRIRRCKSTPSDTRRKNENIPMDNRTDVLEDEQSYANAAYKREEQDYINTYEVIRK